MRSAIPISLFIGAVLAIAPVGFSPAPAPGFLPGLPGAAKAQITFRGDQVRIRTRTNPALSPGGLEGGERAATTAPRQVQRAPAGSSAARAELREVQTALNYFGFDAGTPDGLSGPRTRGAIQAYQALMGYPQANSLQTAERMMLLSAFAAASGGAGPAPSGAPPGSHAWLLEYRDAQLAAAMPAEAEPAAPQEDAPAPGVPLFAQPEEPAPAPAAPGLPNFAAAEDEATTLAALCDRTAMLTRAAGGPVSGAPGADAPRALDEQFCAARADAIAVAADLVAQIGTLTPEQAAQQCAAFGPYMAAVLDAAEGKPVAEVAALAAEAAANSGQQPDQLSVSAQVCLGLAYEREELDVALGSVLLLVGIDDWPYGELVAHHLRSGIGIAADEGLAREWMTSALNAIDEGADPAFLPDDEGRTALLRAAMGGGAAPATPAIPLFRLGE